MRTLSPTYVSLAATTLNVEVVKLDATWKLRMLPAAGGAGTTDLSSVFGCRINEALKVLESARFAARERSARSAASCADMFRIGGSSPPLEPAPAAAIATRRAREPFGITEAATAVPLDIVYDTSVFVTWSVGNCGTMR